MKNPLINQRVRNLLVVMGGIEPPTKIIRKSLTSKQATCRVGVQVNQCASPM
jgi:hypothetical protein